MKRTFAKISDHPHSHHGPIVFEIFGAKARLYNKKHEECFGPEIDLKEISDPVKWAHKNFSIAHPNKFHDLIKIAGRTGEMDWNEEGTFWGDPSQNEPERPSEKKAKTEEELVEVMEWDSPFLNKDLMRDFFLKTLTKGEIRALASNIEIFAANKLLFMETLIFKLNFFRSRRGVLGVSKVIERNRIRKGEVVKIRVDIMANEVVNLWISEQDQMEFGDISDSLPAFWGLKNVKIESVPDDKLTKETGRPVVLNRAISLFSKFKSKALQKKKLDSLYVYNRRSDAHMNLEKGTWPITFDKMIIETENPPQYIKELAPIKVPSHVKEVVGYRVHSYAYDSFGGTNSVLIPYPVKTLRIFDFVNFNITMLNLDVLECIVDPNYEKRQIENPKRGIDDPFYTHVRAKGSVRHLITDNLTYSLAHSAISRAFEIFDESVSVLSITFSRNLDMPFYASTPARVQLLNVVEKVNITGGELNVQRSSNLKYLDWSGVSTYILMTILKTTSSLQHVRMTGLSGPFDTLFFKDFFTYLKNSVKIPSLESLFVKNPSDDAKKNYIVKLAFESIPSLKDMRLGNAGFKKK